jgi:adenylate cyclase
MQQLSLFTRDSLRQSRAGDKGRLRRARTSVQTEIPAWDLWSQSADLEREMALFFLDIRNFTPFAEKHQASDVIHTVKKLFSNFQHIIRIHHGKIIEPSGDGFYAAFGFNGSVKDAVNNAVKAGTAILKALELLNSRSFEQDLRQRIEVGIGIHVGKVATGNLHLGNKDHLVVMGYPVNVASRVQAATRALNNNFIVSSDAYNLLQNPRRKVLPHRQSLKGVKEPVTLYPIGKPYHINALGSINL